MRHHTLTMTVEGNLAADPALRYLPDGTAVTHMRILHTTRVRDGDQWTDGTTTAVNVTAWRSTAEHAAESLTRGDTVIATGTPSTEPYTSRDGEHRAGLQLDAHTIALSLRHHQAHSGRR